MRERLKELPSENMIKYVFGPSIQSDLEKSFFPLMEINKAHLLMLIEQNIITLEDGKEIAKAMNELEGMGHENLTINYYSEDLYSDIEAFIIEKVGAKIGGQLHTGRSRNDLFGTVTRLNARTKLLKSCQQIIDLRKTLLNLAKTNIDTIMPGYTCMQQAEPITFAYYISAHLNAFERDFERLEKVFDKINISPLGAGALAGTTFNIDRSLTANLLGFSNTAKNSLDAIASRDYVLEVLSALSIFTVNLSRFNQDLYIWATEEFSYIEVSGSVAMSSSIMPQKKNPVTFEHIKSKAAHLQGIFISATSSLKNTPYSQVRDSSVESIKYFWDAFNEIEIAIHLMIDTLETMKINKNIMFEKAKNGFSSVSELASTLVHESDLSYRLAHKVMAEVVSVTLNKNETPKYITSDLIADVSENILGRRIVLTDDMIDKALDPVLNINSREGSGGPAISDVTKQLDNLERNIKNDSISLQSYIEQIEESQTILSEKFNLLLI